MRLLPKILQAEDVLEIRSKLQNAENTTAKIREMARLYGVLPITIKNAWTGRTYSWIDERLYHLLVEHYVKKGKSYRDVALVLESKGYGPFLPPKYHPLDALLKKYGLRRNRVEASRVVYYRDGMEEALRGGLEAKGLAPFEEFDIPKKFTVGLYKDGKTLEQIQAALATEKGIEISAPGILYKLHKWRVRKDFSSRMREHYFPGYDELWGYEAGPEHPNRREPGERQKVREAFPSPLGKCACGEKEARARFRKDFYSERFVDKETSRHLVVFICGYHLRKAWPIAGKLGVSRDLEGGEELIRWMRENMPCKEVTLEERECPECGTVYKTLNMEYCSPECANIANIKNAHKTTRRRGRQLLINRVLRLNREEGISPERMKQELKRRWSSTYGTNVYSLSPSTIRRLLSEWEGKEPPKAIHGPNKGRSVSAETRKKISETLKGRYTGENNWNYGSGYGPEVKEKALELYRGGLTAPQVSERFGGKPAVRTICDWAKEAGIAREVGESVSLGLRGKTRRGCYNLSAAQLRHHEERVSTLYDELGSMPAVQRELPIRYSVYRQTKYPLSLSFLHKAVRKHQGHDREKGVKS